MIWVSGRQHYRAAGQRVEQCEQAGLVAGVVHRAGGTACQGPEGGAGHGGGS